MYTCSLCGATLQFVSEHHANMHGMSLKEYKQKNIAKKFRFYIPKSNITEGELYAIDAVRKNKDKTIRRKK